MARNDNIEALFAKLADERARLLDQARALSEEAAGTAPTGGEGEAQWSPKQQWAHMAEMETNYRAWIRAAAERDGVSLTGIAGEPVAVALTEAHEQTNDILIQQLIDQRARTLALLRSLKPGQFGHSGMQVSFGTLTVLQWARSYYRHDRMHTDQIAGRDPGYKPRFAGGVEPGRRRA